MRCGYALKGGSAADFEAEVETDVKQDYATTEPEDVDTREKIETIDTLFDDPEVKTALLERMKTNE